MSTPFTVVYVASRAHSGSTLLDLLVSSHSRVATTGEAKMFQKDPAKRCTCGAESWRDCRFWTAVDRHMLDQAGFGLTNLSINSEDPELFARNNHAFFAAVHAVSGKDVIVDSSKDFPRLASLLRSGLEVRALHLVRHPCGVVFSNVKRGDRLGRQCRLYVRDHLRTAYALRDRSRLEVRYEDLARHPERELRRIMPFLGLEFEPEQMRGWKSRERHNFGGNPMLYDKIETIRLDEKWRAGLRTREKLWIRTRTVPAKLRNGPLLSLAHRMWGHV